MSVIPAAPSSILVVEDEPSIDDVVTTALRFQGHTITQTDHGRKGLEAALASNFDLIVLDAGARRVRCVPTTARTR